MSVEIKSINIFQVQRITRIKSLMSQNVDVKGVGCLNFRTIINREDQNSSLSLCLSSALSPCKEEREKDKGRKRERERESASRGRYAKMPSRVTNTPFSLEQAASAVTAPTSQVFVSDF